MLSNILIVFHAHETNIFAINLQKRNVQDKLYDFKIAQLLGKNYGKLRF